MGEAPAPATTEPDQAVPPAAPASTRPSPSLWESFFGASPSEPPDSHVTIEARGPQKDDSESAVADEVHDDVVPTTSEDVRDQLADDAVDVGEDVSAPADEPTASEENRDQLADDAVDVGENLSAPAGEHSREPVLIGDALAGDEPETSRADATDEIGTSEVEAPGETDLTHTEYGAAPEEPDAVAATIQEDADHAAQPEAASTDGHEGTPGGAEAVDSPASRTAVEEDATTSTRDDAVGPEALLLSGAAGKGEDSAGFEGADPGGAPGPIE